MDPNLAKQILKSYIIPNGEPGTFSCDDLLPPLPVPSLEHTLERYLDSVKPFLKKEEYNTTKGIVETFQNGEGKVLHQKLLQRAKESKNWLEKWWLEEIYLKRRTPLLPYNCGAATYALPGNVLNGGQIKNSAEQLVYVMKFWQLLRDQKLKPDSGRNGSRFSCDQYRRLFSTVRIPKKNMDEIKSFWKPACEGETPRHVIILCRGNIFSLVPFHVNGKPFSKEDWEVNLEKVWKTTIELPYGQSLAVLTSQDRDSWAKHRETLEALSPDNKLNLELIDTAMFVVVLDENSPPTEADAIHGTLLGDRQNRWADKSIHVTTYKNGKIAVTFEHSGFEASIPGAVSLYSYFNLFVKDKPEENNISLITESSFDPKSNELSKIEFKIDKSIKEAVEETHSHLVKNVYNEATMRGLLFTHFGKEFLKKVQFHPDAFCQMALQLTYYKLHNKLAPTYETATTREFYHGRTETVRSCTPEVQKWVEAMSNSKVPDIQKCGLLIQAVKKHTKLMEEAKRNHGCDRHLLGLRMVAEDLGLPVPEIFKDSAWEKSGGNGNFVLSTSLIGYLTIAAGGVPMCKDGYGAFYVIEDHRILCQISSYRNSNETSSEKFVKYLEEAMLQIQKLVISAAEIKQN